MNRFYQKRSVHATTASVGGLPLKCKRLQITSDPVEN